MSARTLRGHDWPESERAEGGFARPSQPSESGGGVRSKSEQERTGGFGQFFAKRSEILPIFRKIFVCARHSRAHTFVFDVYKR